MLQADRFDLRNTFTCTNHWRMLVRTTLFFSDRVMRLKVFALVLALCLFYTASLAQQRADRVSHGTFNPLDCALTN